MINTSAYGVIDECRRHPEIDRIYASEHGIVGLIERRLFDITEEMASEKLLPSTQNLSCSRRSWAAIRVSWQRHPWQLKRLIWGRI